MDVPNSYLLLIVSNLSTNLLCLYVQYLKCFSKLKFDDKKFSKSLLKYAELKTEGKQGLSFYSKPPLHHVRKSKQNRVAAERKLHQSFNLHVLHRACLKERKKKSRYTVKQKVT